MSVQLKRKKAAVLLEKNRRRGQGRWDLLSWTMLYRRRLDPKTLFDLKDHPYLIDIYRCPAREIVVKKAAQVCISEWLISAAFHACDERELDVFYVMPTDGDVSDFSQARFGPALEASPYLASIVVAGGSDAAGKRGADKVTLKRIGDSFLYFRGGQVNREGKARQLKSVPADVLMLDELDEMDKRTPEIARKRLGHSDVAEVRAVSTPTFPGRGIDAVWRESDQREWFFKCHRCGEWQVITIEQIVTAFDSLGRPTAWHGQKEGRAFAACRKCGQELDRRGQGAWAAAFPGRETAGFHPTKLSVPWVNLLEIVQNLHTVDETKRRETVNQDLGETYTPRGGQLTEDILDECRRDYGHGPAVNERPVMGVDVGKVLHGVIRGGRGPETGAWAQRWAGEIESWEELGRVMLRFDVRAAVIDALPETTKAREFQAGRPGVYLAYYTNQKTGSKRLEPMQWDEKEGVVNLDRTRTLDQTFARFYEGLNTLPANAREIKDYYDHLKAPVRILEEDSRGQQRAVYVEDGPDHYAHAENYCGAAMEAPAREVTSSSRSVKVEL